jgi:hypothetical protein
MPFSVPNVPNAPLNEKVQRSFQKLSESAKALNKSSDELCMPIAELDSALQKLNLGVSQWVPIHEEKKGTQVITRYVGYDRVSGRWGISIQQTIRKVPPVNEEIENSKWLYSEAPRWLRTRCLESIPDLLEALAKEAEHHRATINSKLQVARDIVSSVKGTVK